MPGAAWRIRAVFAGVLALLSLSACAPRLQPSGPFTGSASLAGDAFIARDGARLPLRVWRPDGPPRVVVAALHGFNDYSNFFDAAANYLAARGIQTYAYDQRGFGAAPFAGQWFATERYLTDETQLMQLTDTYGRLLDPLKTTIVHGQRAMTTWVVRKS